MTKEINIIIQKDDYPQCNELQFIEIENGEGKSITVGTWIDDGEDKWKIRITQNDWDKLDNFPVDSISEAAARIRGQYDESDSEVIYEIPKLLTYVEAVVGIKKQPLLELGTKQSIEWSMGYNRCLSDVKEKGELLR